MVLQLLLCLLLAHLGQRGAAVLEPLTPTRILHNTYTHRFPFSFFFRKRQNRKMAWQTAPGMLVIIGGFSLVGAMFAGVDGLANWIYKKVCVCVFFLIRKGRGISRCKVPGPCACVYLHVPDKLILMFSSPPFHTHTRTAPPHPAGQLQFFDEQEVWLRRKETLEEHLTASLTALANLYRKSGKVLSVWVARAR